MCQIYAILIWIISSKILKKSEFECAWYNTKLYLEVFMGEQGLIWIPSFIEALIFTAEWQIVREMLNTNPVTDSLPAICSFYTGNITNSNDNI